METNYPMPEQPGVDQPAYATADKMPPAPPVEQAAPAAVTYRMLMRTHPEYDEPYWCRLRALYAGGKKLLGNEVLMKEVFPPHRNEHPEVYAERCRRAHYIPHTAENIDQVVAALTATPIGVRVKTGDGSENETEPPDDNWMQFIQDCSPPGGGKQSLHQLLREQILAALQVRTAWTLVDLPEAKPSEFVNKLEQERSGAREVYAVPVDAECILDWEEDEAGELVWAVIHTTEARRMSIYDSRNTVKRRWVVWTRTDWTAYECEHAKGKPPEPKTEIPRVGGEAHPFGEVPLIRLRLAEGLWAMAKMESPAREHFNKRNQLSWAETQSCLAELYEFQGGEGGGGVTINSEVAQDPDRAKNQQRGQGYVQVRGKDDRAEFVGPDAAPYDHVSKSCDSTRDEIHRTMYRVSLSVANQGAAIRRSGASKGFDRNEQAIVLMALGEYLRDHAERVLNVAARGRGEDDLVDHWVTDGADKFDQMSVDDAVSQATELETVPIPSATFKRMYKLGLAKLVLGPQATPEVMEEIEGELEVAIPDEQGAAAFALGVDGDGQPLVPPAPPGTEPEGDEGAKAAPAGAAGKGTAASPKPKPKPGKGAKAPAGKGRGPAAKGGGK